MSVDDLGRLCTCVPAWVRACVRGYMRVRVGCAGAVASGTCHAPALGVEWSSKDPQGKVSDAVLLGLGMGRTFFSVAPRELFRPRWQRGKLSLRRGGGTTDRLDA